MGADGARSKVARSAGWPAVPTVALLQGLVELPPDIPSNTTRVWFRPDETPYFYWLIPESKTRGALGVIGDDPRLIRQHLDSFAKRLSLTIDGYQAAMIPAYGRWIPLRKKVGAGEVFLVGDAAGQVKVTTVGGLVTGFRGGSAVAHAILTGEKKPVRALKRELNTHLWIRRGLHSFDEDDYKFLIGGLTTSTLSSLRETDRDEAARALWRFVRARPNVVLRAVRAALTRVSR